MYQIGICDDEPIFLQNAAELTKKVLDSHGILCSVRTFECLDELRWYLDRDHGSLDLLLLDIILQEENGIDFIRSLRLQGNLLPVVFITSSMDFVLEGYTAEPLGYLLKPIDPLKLEEALLRAYRKYSSRSVVVNTPSQILTFRPDEILYLEICNKTVFVHTENGNVQEVNISLASFAEKLPAKQFVRCHRSYMVSLPAVSSIWRYMIELKNQERIPVSRTHYKDVQNALLDWAMRTE